MPRTMVVAELEKHLAIRRAKDRDSSLAWDALARMFGTSKQIVGRALGQDAASWQAAIARLKAPPSSIPVITPRFPPEPMVPREYQASAAEVSIGRNTLLVLPTGLGKTIVALLHVQAILSPVAAGICIMMAPTKALLVQHRDLFQRSLAIPGVALAIVDGETTPDNRRTFYKSLAGRRVVLFMTPLTVLNDLDKGRLPRESIIDLVVDEAHHATKGDPYALVYAFLREHHVHPRVLAMTASPGETERRILDVCQHLGIRPSDMIIKNRDDPDVAAHMFKLDVRRYEMALTPEYEDVRGRLVALLREPCAWLQSAGLVRGRGGKKAGENTGPGPGSGSLALPSWDALRLLADKHIAKSAARGIKEGAAEPELEPDLDPRLVNDEPAIAGGNARPDLVSNLVLALRARHCVELVETQGFPALLAYHEKLAAKVAEEPTGSLLALVSHPQYKAAIEIAGKLVRDDSPRARHPKLDVLAGVVRDFAAARPSSRCIVFTKYRASVPMLVAHLSGVAGVVARRFVGQGDSGQHDKGMNRDEQQAVLRSFKAGELNVLVATKAAEEGIDVADCDMVAFYEATASVIQFIQRQGRAGRRRDGDIAIMHAKGTSDQLNAALLDAKLRDMPDILYKVQHVRAAGMPEPRPAAITRMSKSPSSKHEEAPCSTITTRQPPSPSPSSSPSPSPSPSPSTPPPAPPILVHPWCTGAREILAGLATWGVEARLDRSIPPHSMALAGGVQVRVINTNDAADWTAELTVEELPGAARRVVAVCPDGDGELDVRLAGRLARQLARHGIEVWGCAGGGEIAARAIKARGPA